MSADVGIRLFVGVSIAVAAVEGIRDAVESMRPSAMASGLKVKWVAPASYHVTLRFLGWTKPDAVEAVRDQIGAAILGHKPFDLRLKGSGAFPSAKSARVLWVGCDAGAGELKVLADKIDGAVLPLGFAKEKRTFHPHVTVGRLSEPGDLSTVLLAVSERVFSPTRVQSVVLFESHTKTDGSEYKVRATWPLESASNAPNRQT